MHKKNKLSIITLDICNIALSEQFSLINKAAGDTAHLYSAFGREQLFMLISRYVPQTGHQAGSPDVRSRGAEIAM
jgi:hypothetical protein